MIQTSQICLTVTDFDGSTREAFYDVNSFYVENPSCVLGVWTERGGRHGLELTVQSSQTLDEICVMIIEHVSRVTPLNVPTDPSTPPPAYVPLSTAEAEVLALKVHKAMKALLAGELEREVALSIYMCFYHRYGSFHHAFSKHGALHGTALAQRREAAFLLSLETSHGKLSAVFSASTQPTERKIETLTDALLVSLDKTGQVDLELIASLLPQSSQSDAVLANLLDQRLVFEVPPGCVSATTAFCSAIDYLTGDIGSKLRIAEKAAEHDPKFQRNVLALRAALPEPLGPEDIAVGLGADWVPSEVFRDWLYSLFPGESWGITVDRGAGASGGWNINFTNPSLARSDASIRTPRCSGLSLLQSAINNIVPVVHDRSPGGGEVRNVPATLEAQARVLELRQRFESWVFSSVDGKRQRSAERSSQLCQIYNDRFNVFAPRDLPGDHLTFAGLASVVSSGSVAQRYTPKSRQLRGVAKIIAGGTRDRSAYLVYPPGFGKSDPAILAAVKLYQLGLSKRALFAVPKSSLNQWHHRFLSLFPTMADTVLCASDHLFGVTSATGGTVSPREIFLSRIATGDWPFILITHEMLREILLTEAAVDRILRDELADLRACLREAESTTSKDATKQARRSLRTRETSLERISVSHKRKWATLREAERSPVSWEDCEVDHLILDEAHAFKNLGISTRMEQVAGLPSGEGSSRAYDCYIKCKMTLGSGGRVTALSGTPLTNTIAETFVWLRMLQPRLLAHAGLTTFDAFASVFAEAYPSVEMDCVGKYRTQTRLRFRNVPELLALIGEAWDFVRE